LREALRQDANCPGGELELEFSERNVFQLTTQGGEEKGHYYRQGEKKNALYGKQRKRGGGD